MFGEAPKEGIVGRVRLVRSAASGCVAVVGILALATPVALAAVCCLTSKVSFDPSSAVVGQRVRVQGIECGDAASGAATSLALLDRFTLADTAAVGVVQDPLASQDWPRFASVPDGTSKVGSAIIVVPPVLPGEYTLWWACRPSAASSDAVEYHESSGEPLTVELASTDTSPRPRGSREAEGLLIVVNALALLGAYVWIERSRSARPGAPTRRR